MMVAFTKVTAAIEPLLEEINAGSDSWKSALTNDSAVGKTTFVAGTDDLATHQVLMELQDEEDLLLLL